MKTLLINPSIRPNSPKKLLNVGMAYVASAIERAGLDFEILDIDAHRYSDTQIEQLIRTKKFDIVGIGDLVSHYSWVKKMAKLLKTYHPKVPILVGNTLATSIPEFLLETTDVDIAVISEADVTIVELIKKIERGEPLEDCLGIAFKKDGKIKKTPARPVIQPVDSIPFPNYDVFDMDIYLEASKWHVHSTEIIGLPFDDIISMPVVTARGCPFKCTFCFHAFQHKAYRYRSPENIMGEIRQSIRKYNANYIVFWDELSFCYLNPLEKLVDLFLKEKTKFHWMGTCRSELLSEKDIDVIKKLKKSGCVGLGFSLENGNDEILKAMNKKNTSLDFIRQARVLQSVGIRTYAAVVFGYPQETPATIRETFDVLRKAMIYPSVGFLQPMPGTPMFDLALKEGYITDVEDYLHRMGDRQDLRVNMSKMSDKEMLHVVTEECKILNKQLKTSLSNDELIRTRVMRSAKSDTFLDSFGIAAKVREKQQP